MKKQERKKNILTLLATVFICIIIIEVAIRFSGHTGDDDEFIFYLEQVKPYKLPVKRIQRHLDELESSPQKYIVPDSYLGWTIKPNGSHSMGYQANTIGIRSPKEFTIEKDESKTRIALFGDSYVHGQDVPLNQSMAWILEQELVNKGYSVEVMNFGVGGYGMDQAYLRWTHEGKYYDPDIVIIGFQSENCMRNLNVVRNFYVRHDFLAFSKPRFILQDNSLQLINYPTIPYKGLPDEVAQFKWSHLKEYEYFYDEKNYENSIFLKSKIIAGALSAINYLKQKEYVANTFYQPTSPEGKLCYTIQSQFYEEVNQRASTFFVHIPIQKQLQTHSKTGRFFHDPLLNKLKEKYVVIDPAPKLIQEGNENGIASLFVGHYSERANRIVAQEMANDIIIRAHRRLKKQS